MSARLTLLALALASCCPKWRIYDEVSGQARTLTAEKMPAGRTFTGHYWSAQVGAFELREESPGKVSGQLSWASGIADGGSCTLTRALTGDTDGNLATFKWNEELSDGCGPPRSGHGKLIYTAVGDAPPRLFAAWWLGDDGEHFDSWTAYPRGDAR